MVAFLIIMYFMVFSIAGLYFNRNKLIAVVFMLFLGSMISLCTDAPDLENYRLMYINANSSVYALYEPAYMSIAKICQKYAFTYYQFRNVVAIIFLLILICAIRRMTSKINYALILLIIYPCIFFGSGLRSAIAFSVVLLSYSYLFDMKLTGKKRLILFVIGILIATMFHYQSIANMFFVLCEIQINIKKMLCIVVAEVALIFGLLSGILYSVMSVVIHSNKVLSWLDINAYNQPSLIVAISVSVIICFLLLYLKSVIDKAIVYERKGGSELSNSQQQYLGLHLQVLQRCERMVQLLLLFVPSLFINFTFERFFQAPLLAVMIILTTDRYIKKETLLATVMSFTVIFYVIIHGNLYFNILINNMVWERLV